MLEIIVTRESGERVSIDIAREITVELEQENPFLSTDRVPAPWSTAISLPPTDRNKIVFGYLPAMAIAPSVRRIAADLVVDGIILASGILTYSGMEDGNLQYNFSGQSLEDEFNRKIWDPTYALEKEIQDKYGLFAGGNDNEYVAFPLIYNADMTGAVGGSRRERFRNWIYDNNPRMCSPWTPAVFIAPIIRQCFPTLEHNILLDRLAIIGQYKNVEIESPTADADTVERVRGWYEMLPDVSILDLAKIAMDMFCMAVFRDGLGYRLVRANSFFLSTKIEDWTDKVSAIYGLSDEPGQRYDLVYANTDNADVGSENTDAPTEIDPEEEHAGELHSILSAAAGNPEYANYRDINMPDIYSIRGGTPPEVYLSDIVRHFTGVVPEAGSVDEDKDAFERRIGARLCKCTPVRVRTKVSGEETVELIVPVERHISGESERGTDVVLGQVFTGYNRTQMSDKGILPTLSKNGEQPLGSIAVDALYENFHKSFAEWIGKDRQVLEADLNLTVAELSAVRLWQKVRIHGREWMIRRLTMSIPASGLVTARGEFISL